MPSTRAKPPTKKTTKKATKKPAARAATKAAAPKRSAPKPGGKATTAAKAAAPSASSSRFSKKPSGGARGVPAVTSKQSRATAANPYSVHPGVQMMVKWAAELKPKTGRSLDEWVALLKKDAPTASQDRVAFLKSKHGMNANAAWWIAERADGKGAEDLDPDLYLAAAPKYVDEQFAGKKSALRPLYDALLSLCLSMDPRAQACPCKTIVPIYIGNVVAQLKAATNTRIDLGLALGETKGQGRLIETGGYAKKDRLTHHIEITKPADIDDFVKKWLAAAYARV